MQLLFFSIYSKISLRGDDMELLQLKYFLHAARTENFSHTAQNFLVPTSSVSSSIKKLETELGVHLFDRNANKIMLNANGKILLQALDSCERLFAKAKMEIADLAGSPTGELNLLILTNRQKVTESISKFIKRYPQISFSIWHQKQPRHPSTREYDIIVTDQILPSETFDQTFWIREEIYLAVHKDHPFSKRNGVSSHEIQKEKLICLPKGCSLRDYMDAFFQKKKLMPNIAIECDDIQYVRNYIKMGLGVTFFPSVSWKDQISNDVSLLRIDNGIYRDSFIYTNKASSHMAKLFTQILAEN